MVFPALQCPEEETEKLGLEGEEGEGRLSGLGLAGCSSWGCKESDITEATEQAGRQRK